MSKGLTKPQKEEIAADISEVMSRYKEVDNLRKADIIHVYPTGHYGKFNDGYYDAQYFTVKFFNRDTKQMWAPNREFDGLRFAAHAEVVSSSIWLDGSFLVRLKTPATVLLGQCLQIGAFV